MSKLLTLKEAIDQRIPNCVIRQTTGNNFEFDVGEDLGFSISGVHLSSTYWDQKIWIIVTPEEIQKQRDDYIEPSTKAYKIEILIIDHDMLGEKEIVKVIENQHYPNRCIMPEIMKIESRDIGIWDDDHPLNSGDKDREEYERLFGS